MLTYINTLLIASILLSCRLDPKPTSIPVIHLTESEIPVVKANFDTTLWTELTAEDGFVIDIKYATADNFVNEAVYPCGRCFLKPDAAKALSRIQEKLKIEGYRLKLFDCYRPKHVQEKLWKKVPNPNYVARPSDGSMHNRGTAVDLTLTDASGKELNMGTPYDFFGPEAHHDYTNLPKEVLSLRKKLKNIMEANGFASIRTEWWHYSYTRPHYPLAAWQWPCID